MMCGSVCVTLQIPRFEMEVVVLRQYWVLYFLLVVNLGNGLMVLPVTVLLLLQYETRG